MKFKWLREVAEGQAVNQIHPLTPENVDGLSLRRKSEVSTINCQTVILNKPIYYIS